MFLFDIETLDTESTAVVLSMGLTHVTDETTDYQKMLDNSLFLKLQTKDQINKGRTISKDTLEGFWDKQVEIVKETSLYPKPTDLTVEESMVIFKQWLNDQGFTRNDCLYTRGSLDSSCLLSLCKAFDLEVPIRYNKFYDVRTLVDFIYDETAKDGYVDVVHETFNPSMVIKHHPVHDCAYDGMMLIYGKK